MAEDGNPAPWRIPRAVAVLTLSLWAGSLFLPVFDLNSTRSYGFELLLFGWLGLLIGSLSWLANPFILLVALLLWSGRGARLLLPLSAIVLLAVFFAEVSRTELIDNEGAIPHMIERWFAGWWLWMAAVATAQMAALASWAARVRVAHHGSHAGLHRSSQAQLGRWGEER